MFPKHSFRLPVKTLICSMRILSVAEKNEAAKGIAGFLSNGHFNRREGLSKYNKIYEFDIKFRGVNSSMIMTSVSGHLMDYQFEGSVANWQSVDPAVLFDVPIIKKTKNDMVAIEKTLKSQAQLAQVLIIWTDCDREGDNIGMEIVQVCRQVNRNLTVLRATFSEITHQAVNRAMQNLGPINQRNSDAVDVRQELDLRTGSAFTRLQTVQLRKCMPANLAQQVISYGSCQFPTLGFVIDRFRTIDSFIPEPFWKISAQVQRNRDSVADFTWARGRLFDKDTCQAIYDVLLEHPIGHILDVTQRPKTKFRPVAMDTIELEMLSSRKLRLSAKETMSIAEKLYTRGLISYPRTETNIFPKDFNLTDLVRVQSSDNRWKSFAENLLSSGVKPRNGKKSDQAHPPIHPLKSGSDLQGNEARVYELIARHFLACLSADAQGAETTVQMLVLGSSLFDASKSDQSTSDLTGGELFECKGLVILKRNYLDVYPYERWAEKDMPNFSRGEWIDPVHLKFDEGKTSPPQLLTEADLIAMMDKFGIGTDATHAEHIEKIKQRLYVGLHQDKYLMPGQLGMGLITGYDSMGLQVSKPQLRAKLEADLKLICEGNKDPQQVLREHLLIYKQVYTDATRKLDLLYSSVNSFVNPNSTAQPPNQTVSTTNLGQCPACSSSNLVVKSSGGSWSVSCDSNPVCKYAIRLPKDEAKDGDWKRVA
ncbi:DNA topoisomerase 3-alpha [Cichlidogyrus casuarinus]|uniref:DNA topoisomerase n=1 Tax=Cichlidogyrus casuarinus TaxID=1844966 RepID=A0ABD2QFX9_9PLAT